MLLGILDQLVKVLYQNFVLLLQTFDGGTQVAGAGRAHDVTRVVAITPGVRSFMVILSL